MSLYVRYSPVSLGGGGGGSGVSSIGTLDGNAPSSDGASITGAQLFMQSASATFPGLVNTSAQTFAGAKTFNSPPRLAASIGHRVVILDGSLDLDSSSTTDTELSYLNGATSNIQTQINAKQNIITIDLVDAQPPNDNALALFGDELSTQSATALYPGVVTINNQTFAGNKTFTGTISAANLSGTNTGNVTLGSANGLSLAGQVLSLALSSTSTTGALTSTDWNTFNGKQNTITVGALDAQAANATGLALVSNVLSTQSADATHPGLVNTTAQTLAGAKTFTSSIVASGGIDVVAAGTLAIGTLNASTINIGNAGAIINIQGTVITEVTSTLNVTNPVFTVNHGGSAGSASNSGMQVEENAIITGYAETSADRNSWIFKAPNTAGVATVTPGAGGITLNQSSHNPVTIGTANGLSLSTQVLSLALADTSTTGALSSTDWNTFNNKQTAGNYITALTGDATASGPGSVALTLATVNGNVGSFGSASSVATFTANAKGLITAAGSTSIQIAESQVTNLVSDLAGKQGTITIGALDAQAANATGLALVANTLSTQSADATHPGMVNTTTQSFAGQKTFTTGVTATLTGTASGNTTISGQVNHGVVLASTTNAMTSSGTGTVGQVLTSNGSGADPTFQTPATSTPTAPTIQKFTSGSGTYTKPTSPAPLYIKVEMVGAGGGGGGSGSAAGSDGGSGGNTTFGSSLLVANGGGGGASGPNNGFGGSGGSGSLGSGPIGIALSGGIGNPGSGFLSSAVSGGSGAASAFGGAGGGQSSGGGSTVAGQTNTGGGGGGGSDANSTYKGGGGGSGGYVDAIITSPASTYSYAVGAGGSAGSAGTLGNPGGAGGSGIVVVTEYYQ